MTVERGKGSAAPGHCMAVAWQERRVAAPQTRGGVAAWHHGSMSTWQHGSMAAWPGGQGEAALRAGGMGAYEDPAWTGGCAIAIYGIACEGAQGAWRTRHGRETRAHVNEG